MDRAMKAWAILLVAVAVALAVYPFQPFTGSFLVVLGAAFAAALVVGVVAMRSGLRRT